jgi:hypothetical protein
MFAASAHERTAKACIAGQDRNGESLRRLS